MTPEQRAELIVTLAWITGWSEDAFSRLTDEELQERYNRIVEVKMDGRV